ncbi:MAG: four helix bundle protein [Legionella sp.]|uniref:four helix bundle protein n=1 Tax=Legionella sp. TaxID=459 RepID=UPI0039E696B7
MPARLRFRNNVALSNYTSVEYHDQLQRAGSSVVLNIAEGAGEFSMNEKIRFYRMARRSATECAGILDICMHFNLIDENISLTTSRHLVLRIVSMLTKMARITSGKQAAGKRSRQ